MNWQPIETAPKDGTEILVYFDFASVPIVHIAWFNSKEEFENSGQYCTEQTLDEWLGWWSYKTNSFSQYRLTDIYEPTHWMPLPEPPK